MNTGMQLLSFLLAIGASVHLASAQLDVIYEWTQLEFDYATEEDRAAAIADGSFNVGKILPLDADVEYADYDLDATVFVTVPRGTNFQTGVPSTLSTVSNKTYNGNPVLTPYPDWSWHQNLEQCNANRLVSVFRIAVDKKCNRLWVLDTGGLETQICSPQILAFDLRTNEVVHRYQIPTNDYNSVSLFVTPIVDVRDSCENTFVYAADVQWYSLLVHDVAANTSWHIRQSTFTPQSSWTSFLINGTNFTSTDGIFGMTLSPYVEGLDRALYYHALASNTEQWVLTSDIRNKHKFAKDATAHTELFHVFSNRRYTQSAAEAMDRRGVLYFSLLGDTSIGCWNSYMEYLEEGSWDYVDQNTDTLQFPSGMKVISNYWGHEELWTVTSRFQRVATSTLNSTEVNFRILAGNIRAITAGKKCDI